MLMPTTPSVAASTPDAVNLELHFLGVGQELRGSVVALRAYDQETKTEFIANHEPDMLEINGLLESDMSAVFKAVRTLHGHRLLGADVAIHDVDSDGEVGAVVGGLCFTHLDDAPGTVELGISLRTGCRGQGRAVEALRLATDHFQSRGLRVQVATATTNVPMLRVLQKFGAERLENRPRTLPNGQEVETARFVLLPT